MLPVDPQCQLLRGREWEIWGGEGSPEKGTEGQEKKGEDNWVGSPKRPGVKEMRLPVCREDRGKTEEFIGNGRMGLAVRTW